MLIEQTTSDTLFECPNCGQRGSVPTDVLQAALVDTPDVRISCTNCPTKFLPIGPAKSTLAHPNDAIADNLASDTPPNEPETDSDDQSIVDAIKSDMSQMTDAPMRMEGEVAATDSDPTDSITRDELSQNDGSLPDWLRPASKKPDAQTTAPIDDEHVETADIEAAEEVEETKEDAIGGPAPEAQVFEASDINADLTEPNLPEPDLPESDLPESTRPETASASAEDAANIAANIEEEEDKTEDDAEQLTQWDDWQDDETAQAPDAYRQPVDLLNAVQLVLLTIVALLFALSGFMLLSFS